MTWITLIKAQFDIMQTDCLITNVGQYAMTLGSHQQSNHVITMMMIPLSDYKRVVLHIS